MPLTLTTPAGTQTRVPGRWTEYHSLGGDPLHGYAGLATVQIQVDLAATAYETGGIPLSKEVTGLQRVVNMWVLAGVDPFAGPLTPTNGLTFTLNSDNPENPLLVINDAGGELANGATQAAGSTVWLLLGGMD